MQTNSISFPSEKTKNLLLQKLNNILFKSNKTYGITNPKVFQLFNFLFAENINGNYNEMQPLKTYSSFLAIKTFYIEEEKPEALLTSFLEIDLMEKIKKEFSNSDNGFLKIIAYRNIPLKHHRNIRVIEILYEKTLSLFFPFIKTDNQSIFQDGEGEMEMQEKNFHKIFDFIKQKINGFQGNLIHELNIKYAEIRIDSCTSGIKARIHAFFKQNTVKHFFFEMFEFMEQYANKYYKLFSLEKIWTEYLLASFFRISGNDQKAKDKLDNMLDLFQRVYGLEQLEISDILMSLSNILSINNQNQAIEFMERSLALRLKYLHKDHLKVAYVYMNLGSLNFSMKILGKATLFFEKALKIFEKHYSEDYPWDSLGYTLFSLGNICLENKNFTSAFYYLKSSMNVYNNFIIPNDIMVVTILGIMTKICDEFKNFTEGYTYSLQALKIMKHTFGEGNEKFKSFKKVVKSSKKFNKINVLMSQSFALDKRLRKSRIFKRKAIINDILSYF